MNSYRDRDDLLTLISIGILAYASADVAHHMLGHAGMCRATGGRIVSLSSVQVFCSRTGSQIDLAGPLANLAIGLAAGAVALPARQSLRLFLVLTCGFNLFWFAGQMAFSAATRTDDFAWPLAEFHASEPLRFGLVALGVLLYALFRRFVASLAAPFGPRPRARRIFMTVWLTAGLFACATASFDPHPWRAIVHFAAPQSWLLSLGWIFLPRRLEGGDAPPLHRQWGWIFAALAAAIGSFLFLGPGFAIGGTT